MTEHLNQSEFRELLKQSPLQRDFETAWRQLVKDLPAPVGEFKFHKQRKWRFDYAWPDSKVAVELNGGTFNGGAHVRGRHLHDEYDKLNSAQLQGWAVLVFDTEHCRDYDSMVSIVSQLLRTRHTLGAPGGCSPASGRAG